MRTIHPRSRTLLAAGLLAGIALSGSVTANAGISSAPQARSGATCADPGTGRDSLKVIGLTDFQRLMCFDENTPGQSRTSAGSAVSKATYGSSESTIVRQAVTSTVSATRVACTC